jgi:hypothetical protein
MINDKGMMSALASEAQKIIFHTSHEDQSRSGSSKIVSDSDRITVQDRAYTQLMHLLPTRSMLPYLRDELVERDPTRVNWTNHSYLSGYEGAPSIGKSFMIKTLGKLSHPKGALYLHCRGVDLGTAFCETVFDTSSANKEKAALDAKIRQGNINSKNGLNQRSLEILKHALGDAYSEEKRGTHTVVNIDWNGIKVKGRNVQEQEFEAQSLRETLKQVCKAEGIAVTSDLGSIGITTRDGIAIRAADPNSPDYGRPILLDEFNLAEEGTETKLTEFFAMLSDSKVDKLEVTGGQNRSFTFYRNSLPPTYRVNFTSNQDTAKTRRNSLDAALMSRFGIELDVKTVPDPSLQDFADRIAQALTGVPLAQIYYSAQEQFDKNPELFTKILTEYRKGEYPEYDEKGNLTRVRHALTDNEKALIPEEELLNIRNAKKILQMSEQLAEFFGGLSLRLKLLATL